jgi:hypothetical protein
MHESRKQKKNTQFDHIPNLGSRTNSAMRGFALQRTNRKTTAKLRQDTAVLMMQFRKKNRLGFFHKAAKI